MLEGGTAYYDAALRSTEADRAKIHQCFDEIAYHQLQGDSAAAAVAGAAIRYRDTHRNEVEDIVALDIALHRNDRDWVEQLPAEMESQILHKLYYGHFFCHVFHQDYIVKKGVDPLAMEHQMSTLLDARRAEYPAEHNVGHLYIAKPALANFYQKLDPTNRFNVGIGHTSKLKYWGNKLNNSYCK